MGLPGERLERVNLTVPLSVSSVPRTDPANPDNLQVLSKALWECVEQEEHLGGCALKDLCWDPKHPSNALTGCCLRLLANPNVLNDKDFCNN